MTTTTTLEPGAFYTYAEFALSTVGFPYVFLADSDTSFIVIRGGLVFDFGERINVSRHDNRVHYVKIVPTFAVDTRV